MRYYIIAGEASGDLHGSNLIRELKHKDPSAQVRCWGGDLMQEAGGTLVKHYRDLAFMGFIEVLVNLRTILRNIEFCKEDIRQFQPDCLVLIDYPGFNLRIARWARDAGFRVIYYISPQVWAWKENRVRRMKTCIDRMLVILPFEKEYFRSKWNWNVEYVGHPLVEVIDRFKASGEKLSIAHNKPIVALLPGSRKQEIEKKLPVMLQVSRDFPQYEFIIAKAPGLNDSFYNSMLAPYPNVSSVSNRTYALLNSASAALVTSGTATLETALFGVPEMVCYKGNPVSYLIARQVIKVKYISLVNLIMNRPVVNEFIQKDLTAANLGAELRQLMTDMQKIGRIREDYRRLHELLVEGGNASAHAARSILRFLEKHPSAEKNHPDQNYDDSHQKHEN